VQFAAAGWAGLDPGDVYYLLYRIRNLDAPRDDIHSTEELEVDNRMASMAAGPYSRVPKY